MDNILLLTRDEVSSAVKKFRTTSETKTLFAAYMAQYNDTGRALRRLALTMWADQNLVLARDALLAAQALDVDNPDLWRDLAGVYVGLNDGVHAEACLHEALSREPDHAASWLMLGEQQNTRGDIVRAEQSYRQALRFDPTLATAYFGLGLILFQAKNYEESAVSLKACTVLEPMNAVAHLCLGHVQYLIGDFAHAVSSFAAADAQGVLDQSAQRKYARARTFQKMIAGDVEKALADYPAIAGSDCEDVEIIARDAFSLLSAFGYLHAARALGSLRLAQDPGDPMKRYLLDAVSGKSLPAAPLDYLEKYFDAFAPGFERQLVQTLDYHVPEFLADMVTQSRGQFDRALDLGCGTGLAGIQLRPFCRDITGLDISSGMLAQSEKSGAYNTLIKSDAGIYLDTIRDRFDLMIGADFVIYIGDVRPIFCKIHQALKPGGLFAFNYEISDSRTYDLLTSGRFAHHPHYIAAALSDLFDLVKVENRMIRLEANRPVDGQLIVAQRKG